MKRLVWTVLTVGFLNAQCADAGWGLRFDVSRDGGATWQSSVDAAPGETISFRFGAYFDTSTKVSTLSGTGPVQTLCRFTGQNQVLGLAAGDVLQSLVTRTTNFHPNVIAVAGNVIGTSGPNSFASNLYLHGLPSKPVYYNPIYTGEIRISSDAAVRTLNLCNKQFGSGAVAGLTFFNGGYLPKQEIAAPIDNPNHLDVNAVINVVPAPGTLALAIAVLAAGRRRERRTVEGTGRAEAKSRG